MRTVSFLSYTTAVVGVGCFLSVCEAGEIEFNKLLEKMENEVLEFGRLIEHYYRTLRCDPYTLSACNGTNYHETLSEFPGQKCYTSDDYKINECNNKNGTTTPKNTSSCGSLRDYTTSSVRIPHDLVAFNNTDYYPNNPQAVEMICYSASMDRYLQSKMVTYQQWPEFQGLRSPQVYFGHSSGAFRIYPGKTSEKGGEYDPRKRPWYIAASSGPKNVILILDMNRSMDEGQVKKLKDAVNQTISSLTGADRIAVVAQSCSDCDYLITDEKDKQELIQKIYALETFGYNDTFDAFNEAFNILLKDRDYECRTAILYLTDGSAASGQTPSNSNTNTTQREGAVIELVESKIQQFANDKHNVTVFTYTIGETDDAVEAFPKKLACQTGGVWSRIVDSNDISDILTSYYELFTIGYGTGLLVNFTTWVDLYEFAGGDNVRGTTVSTPVFDRVRNLFLGVVGMDLPLEALYRLLGVDAKTKIRDKIRRSWAKNCPTWNPTQCELERFRRRGAAGDDALCTDDCSTDSNNIEDMDCPGTTLDNNTILLLPIMLWADTSYRGFDFSKRICCKEGETKPSDQCPVTDDVAGSTTNVVEVPRIPSRKWSDSMVVGLIVGVSITGAIIVFLVAAMAWIVSKKPIGNNAPRAIPALPRPIQPPERPVQAVN